MPGHLYLHICLCGSVAKPCPALKLHGPQPPGSPVLHYLLLKFILIESVMLYNHLILCHYSLLLPAIFPRIKVFQWADSASDGPSTGTSASALILPMNIQCWFPVGFTSLISLQYKSLLQQHSLKASILHHSAFFVVQLSHPYMITGKKKHSFDYMDLYWQSDVSSF